MKSQRNKSQMYVRGKDGTKKSYFSRLMKVDIYSYIKDNHVLMNAKPEEVIPLFNENVGTHKKMCNNDKVVVDEDSKIDQGALHCYQILAF